MKGIFNFLLINFISLFIRTEYLLIFECLGKGLIHYLLRTPELSSPEIMSEVAEVLKVSWQVPLSIIKGTDRPYKVVKLSMQCCGQIL